MTKLLKDKNDYFFVNIIGFIGKNKIRAIYNSEPVSYTHLTLPTTSRV